MRPLHWLILLLPLACGQQYEQMLLGALQSANLVPANVQADCTLPSPLEVRLQWEPYEEFFKGFLNDMRYYSQLCAFEEAESAILDFLGNEELFDITYGNYVMLADIESSLAGIYAQLDQDGLTYDAGSKVGQMIKTMMMLNTPYTMHFRTTVKESDFKQVNDGTPLAIFHGIGDCCCFPGMGNFTAHMAAKLGVYTRCVEIGSGPMTSWFSSMTHQVSVACQSIKSDPNFANGFNVLGLSQGGLIARAVVETCGLPVSKLVTMGGPHMGVASFPQCEHGFFCDLLRDMLDTGAYIPYFQKRISPAGYYRDPYTYNDYVKGCEFLPIINNQQATKSASNKSSLTSLDLMLLIKFTKDTVVDPQESEWFGYYADNTMRSVLTLNQTADFQNDWLGLKTLSEAGKIELVEIPAQHLQMTLQQVDEYIVAALQD